MTVDLEGFTYLRQDQNGVLLGIYEIDYEHWAMDGAPWDYGMELFQEQTDRIEQELIAYLNAILCFRMSASRHGSTVPSPSRPMAIRSSDLCQASEVTGAPVLSWQASCKGAASVSRWPNG